MIRIEFDTDNAAFDGDGGPHEAARLVRSIATHILAGVTGSTIIDNNGNTIGTWSAEFDNEEET